MSCHAAEQAELGANWPLGVLELAAACWAGCLAAGATGNLSVAAGWQASCPAVTHRHQQLTRLTKISPWWSCLARHCLGPAQQLVASSGHYDQLSSSSLR